MGSEIANKNKDSTFHGPYAGGDMYIVMLEDKEREFIVTHSANIKPVSYFTGREKELQELRQKIEEKRKSVLISGMGGIGKTHICRKLFEEYLMKHASGRDCPFQHIGYIEYSGDMTSSLQICLKYKLQEQQEANQEAAWRELEYLASDGNLLLFIDNVDKLMREDPGLQRLNSIPGTVVLTTRQTSFSDEFESYQIDFLGIDQCKEIYEKIRFERVGGIIKMEEVQDLEYIVDKLAGRHTITVEFLAHLAWTKRWTVKRLRNELEQKGFKLEFHKNGELVNIQQTYEVLYDLSRLSEAEQNILEAFSVFPYIPLSAEICNQWLFADAGVNEDDDILIELYQKGWLQFNLENESYAMHPVFTQFIYDKYMPDSKNHSELIKECQNCLEIPDSGKTLECRKFIPFAESIIEKLDMEKGTKEAEFILSLAYLLQYMCEYENAERWYRKSLSIYVNILGADHLDTATIYNNLGEMYVRQGKYKEAKESLEKFIRISSMALGEEHPDTATGYNNLGQIYKNQGKYTEAEKLHKKCLQIREKILGKNHMDTAASYNNLADVYDGQGKYVKAIELYKKSLLIREKLSGEEHPDTATSYSNLGLMYIKQGKYAEAEKLHKKSLQIREKILGREHTDTATSYNNLAFTYTKQERYAEAEELYKKSLRIFMKVFGETHPDVAICYENLASIYMEQRYYEKAERLYKKSLRIKESVFNEEHPKIAHNYNNLACMYVDMGDYEKAKELFEKSIRIYKNTLGKEHPYTAMSYAHLARVFMIQEEYGRAKELYKRSLRIYEKVLGENHPDTAMNCKNLARVYEKKGEYGKAEEMYEKSLRICKNVLGENHPSTVIICNNLAGVYRIKGEYGKAEEMYKKSLTICEKVLGITHPYTAITYNNLAFMYASQGEYINSIAYFLKAYKSALYKLGFNHPNTQLIMNNMKWVYSQWNPESNFEQWLEEKMKEND